MNSEGFAYFCWLRINWPRLLEVGWAELVGHDELNGLLLEDWRNGAR